MLRWAFALLTLVLSISAAPSFAGEFEDGLRAYARGDCDTALSIWSALADSNDAAGQYGMGRLFANGCGVERDYVKARKQFQRALDGGYVNANNGIGFLYAAGLALPKNELRAAEHFRLAAENGLDIAQLNLASIYLFAEGVPHDEALAFTWALRAAKQGYPRAKELVAMQYGTGIGTKPDLAESARWFCLANATKLHSPKAPYPPLTQDSEREAQLNCIRQAAIEESEEAQYTLGVMYEQGQWVPQDFEQAVTYYRQAADHNMPMARYRLARMWDTGQAGKTNRALARKLAELAAFSGDVRAKVMLGTDYAQGIGGPQNSVLGAMWLIRGSIVDDSDLRTEAKATLDALTAQMTADEIARAKNLAWSEGEWRP
jgi:TPR repeat protein